MSLGSSSPRWNRKVYSFDFLSAVGVCNMSCVLQNHAYDLFLVQLCLSLESFRLYLVFSLKWKYEILELLESFFSSLADSGYLVVHRSEDDAHHCSSSTTRQHRYSSTIAYSMSSRLRLIDDGVSHTGMMSMMIDDRLNAAVCV